MQAVDHGERVSRFISGRKRVRRFELQPIHSAHTRLLFALYKEQVHGLESIRLQAAGMPADGRKATLDRWEAGFQRYLDAAFGRPVFATFGSARDSVSNHPASSNANTIITIIGELAYRLGIGAVSGHFHRGWMWTALRAWLVQRANARKEGREILTDAERVFIGGVPLLEPDDFNISGGGAPTADQALLLALVDKLSPPQASFESRSPAIMGAAQTLLCIYGPDGIGTGEELIRDVLGEQHSGISQTVWTGRPKPAMREVILLDSRLKSGCWGYDWLLMKAATNVALTSTKVDDWKRIHCIRIGNGVVDGGPISAAVQELPVQIHWFDDVYAAAEFVVDRGIAVHEALRTAYIALLQNGSGEQQGEGLRNSH